MAKEAMAWTKGLIKRFNFHAEKKYGSDRDIIVGWNTLKYPDVMTDKDKFNAVEKLQVRVFKFTTTATGDSEGILCETGTDIKKTYNNWEFTAPSDATEVRIQFRLIAKSSSSKYKNSGWTTAAPSKSGEVNYTPNLRIVFEETLLPDPPSSINTETTEDGMYLIASVSESDTNIEAVKFNLYKRNDTTLVQSSNWITFPSNRYAEYRFSISPGVEYDVRGQYRNTLGKISNESDTQIYKSDTDPIPAQVTNVNVIAETTSRVKITWDPVQYAAETGGYEVARATNSDFLGTNMATIDTVDGSPAYASVDSGNIWYFQVRAKNKNGKSGPWSEMKSCAAAKKPNMPTTWSMSSSYKIDEQIRLFWTYNSADNAKPSHSYIHYKINGGTEQIHTITHNLGEEDTNYTFFWDLTTEATLSDSDRVTWWVVCDSIGGTSEPSVVREIRVYQTPTVTVSFPHTVSTYPIDIGIEIRPSSQHLVSGYINIYANNTYDTQDRHGKDVTINAGDRIFTQIFTNESNIFTLSLTPADISLEDEQSYRIELAVTLNSGLSTDNSNQEQNFETLFVRPDFMISSGASYNYDFYTASLIPFCMYIDDEGESTGELVPNTVLSVYRINSDGSFTTIRENFPNYGNYAIMDPHPLMDTMTYRVVSMNMENGAQAYTDVLVEDINLVGIIIQWDESYRDYKTYVDTTDAGTDVGRAYSGSMIRILTNVKTSESSGKDVEKIPYIGKEDPTTYYGTQKGKVATWSCEIDKTDEAMIALIRRLDDYMGDVYVRNQYGVGYWANVEVNYNLDYDNLVMPITFQITKVDSDRP